ncbi:hypothetical protein CLOP_g21761 [Closterium sp. NIES-67]|nr:hypothetical protein CLOP_g21761 [Closterium sp. NIES-67]
MAFLARPGLMEPSLDVAQLALEREQQMVQRWGWQREQEGPLGRVVGEALERLLPDAPAMAARADIVAVLTHAIRAEFYAARLIPFGSYEMGLSSNTSDLDLSLEVSPPPSLAPSLGVGMGEPRTRDARIAVLRRVATVIRRLERAGAVHKVEVVLRAIVPVVKFVHSRSRVDCDISVANRDGFFKSRFIRFVSSIDPRFRHLCFLVKAWARNEAINDPRNGTLNSLALILLCALHLQTRSPPILPPFKDLMGHFPEPLSSGRDSVPLPEQELLERLAHAETRAAEFAQQGYGRRNTASLPHLLASFFVQMTAQEGLWTHMLCGSVYEGRWIERGFPQENHVTVMAIEDFLHRTSNCARTVRVNEFETISAAFSRAARAVMDAPCPPPSLSSASSLVDLLIGSSPRGLEDAGRDERNGGGVNSQRRGRERDAGEERRREQKRGREWIDGDGDERSGDCYVRGRVRTGGGGSRGRRDEERWNGGERGDRGERGNGVGAAEEREAEGRWRGVEEEEDWRTRPVSDFVRGQSPRRKVARTSDHHQSAHGHRSRTTPAAAAAPQLLAPGNAWAGHHAPTHRAHHSIVARPHVILQNLPAGAVLLQQPVVMTRPGGYSITQNHRHGQQHQHQHQHQHQQLQQQTPRYAQQLPFPMHVQPPIPMQQPIQIQQQIVALPMRVLSAQGALAQPLDNRNRYTYGK